MDALDKMVNPDSTPKSRTSEVILQCVHPDGKHRIVWDPAKPGRAICPDCEAVYNVTCVKDPAPGK